MGDSPTNFIDPFGLYSSPIPLVNGRIEAGLRDKARLCCQTLSKPASRYVREALTEAEFKEASADATTSVRGTEILDAVARRMLVDPAVPKQVKDEIQRFLDQREEILEKARWIDEERKKGVKDPKPFCPLR